MIAGSGADGKDCRLWLAVNVPIKGDRALLLEVPQRALMLQLVVVLVRQEELKLALIAMGEWSDPMDLLLAVGDERQGRGDGNVEHR